MAAFQGAAGEELSGCGGFVLNDVVTLKDHFRFGHLSDQRPDRRKRGSPVRNPPRHDQQFRAVALHAPGGLEPCDGVERVEEMGDVLRGQG